jgi:5,5'-dehydrodivanillate O-demethylase oxygenase subunit
MNAAQNDRLCRVGPGTPCGNLMRRYWHPIAASSQLADAGTMPIRLLGEDFVLYRDRSGGLGLIEPHCAHRGAGMLFGIPDECGLRCSYHGWVYDATGQCIEQPFETFVDPANRYMDRVRLEAHPIEELGGLIWTYFGPEPRPLIPHWEGLVREDVKREIGMAILPCNWLQSLENSGDSPHVVYAHRAFSQYVFEKLGRPDLTRHAFSSGMDGFQPKRPPERSPYGWGSHMFPYSGAIADQYQMRVPVDDTHTLHIWYVFYTAENERELGIEVPPQDDPRSIPFFEVPVPGLDERRQPQWSLLDGNSGQDILMWASQGAIYDRTREHLGHGDEQIIRARQLLEEQISIVEEGGDPLNVFRDPAENQCIVPRFSSKISRITPDGRVDRTNDARKYSPIVTNAAAKRDGEESLSEPVH